MVDLTSNQRSFIDLMKKTEEHARRGFALLLERPAPDLFFDPLREAGFFDPSKNPGPIIEKDGIRIPFWGALDYIRACARIAADRYDLKLAAKIVDIVRTVSLPRESSVSGMRDNHHTARYFAEIIGLLPVQSMTLQDMDLVREWVSVRFNPGGVALALDRGPLSTFLQSNSPDDWQKALRIFRHCLTIRWEVPATSGSTSPEPTPVIEDYWLEEVVKHHAPGLASRLPAETATTLEDGVREVFSQGTRAKWSHVYRPAVEDHEQNRPWRAPENSLVEALRDVTLHWLRAGGNDAKQYVARLLGSDVAILRRIGVYVLKEEWSLLKELYPSIVAPQLFQTDLVHEVYDLLHVRFESLSDADKDSTLAAIRAIPLPKGENDLERVQLRWLSALEGTTYEPAAQWLADLKHRTGLNSLSHPAFDVYSESTDGPGPTPYQTQDLVAFAEEGQLAERLSAFVPTGARDAPTVGGLTDALEQVVATAPRPLLRALPSLSAVAPEYQRAVISGFRKLWDGASDLRGVTWEEVWRVLIACFKQLIADPRLDAGGPDGRHEVVAGIADYLSAGTRDDNHSYPSALLPDAWPILVRLLAIAGVSDQPDLHDPMFHAINSTRGHALQALFNHALRACRCADADTGSHADVWAGMKSAFDSEIAMCDGRNYEFSTLCGAYLGQLEYMSGEWVGVNIARVFPVALNDHFESAVGGLAYSRPTRRTVGILRDAKVFDIALARVFENQDSRRKLIEILLLGYIWGDDDLRSSRLSLLFSKSPSEDLQTAAAFLSGLRGQVSQDQVGRLVSFWVACVEWAEKGPEPPARLLATLGHLAWTLGDADGENRRLLLASAPYLHVSFGVFEFVDELIRLVEKSPEGVAEVLGALVKASVPPIDYKDRLQSLILRLAKLGQRRVAIDCCERLRDLPGMVDLFNTLTSP